MDSFTMFDSTNMSKTSHRREQEDINSPTSSFSSSFSFTGMRRMSELDVSLLEEGSLSPVHKTSFTKDQLNTCVKRPVIRTSSPVPVCRQNVNNTLKPSSHIEAPSKSLKKLCSARLCPIRHQNKQVVVSLI